MNNIYLDNAATTPLSPQVKDYVVNLLDIYGNPSTMYQSGIDAKKVLEEARSNVARFINSDVQNIIFTSGGSASNTLVIHGYALANNCKIFYSPLLHKSAIKCIEDLDCASDKLTVFKDGQLNIYELIEKIKLSKEQPFIVLEYANSEIGTIHDVKNIIHLAHQYNGIVYLDCTGSIPSISLDVKELDVDLAGFSAHKLGALKGCGILYRKEHITLKPLIYGAQEQGLFAGTENMIGIGSLGKAVENYDYRKISSKNRDYVYDYILKNMSDTYLVGASFDKRLPLNLYICIKGIKSESLMTLMDMNHIQINTGSACNSGVPMPSSTLQAIGIDSNDIHSCIRLSFSGNETKDELDYVCRCLKKNVDTLRIFN